MTDIKRIFSNAQQCHQILLDVMRAAKAGEFSGAHEIIVRPFKSRRSNPQNARLWVIHTKAAMAVNMLTLKSGQNNGEKWTPNDFHQMFKELYLGADSAIVNGRKIFKTKSTTTMSREDMAKAQEKYEAYLISDLGLEIDFND